MAINITIDTVLSGFNLANMNANFVEIQTQLLDSVSRSGTSPNTMLADFDLNSNDLLNGGIGNFTDVKVGGVSIVNNPASAAAIASAAAAAISETNAAASEAAAAVSASDSATSAAESAASAVSALSVGEGLFAEDWDNITTWAQYERCLHEGIYYYALSSNINEEPFVGSSIWAVALDRFTGGTLTSKATLAASTVTEASINVPTGSAPSTPVVGDVWQESGRLRHEIPGPFTNDIMQPFVPLSWPTGMSIRTQVATTSTWAAYASATIPFDDTVPVVTEGSQVLTGSWTPRLIGNDYVTEVLLSIFLPSTDGVVVSVFEDSTCIGSFADTFPSSEHKVLSFKTPSRNISSLTAKTMSVRVGIAGGVGAIIYINGNASSRLLGGSMSSTISVIETAEYTP